MIFRNQSIELSRFGIALTARMSGMMPAPLAHGATILVAITNSHLLIWVKLQ